MRLVLPVFLTYSSLNYVNASHSWHARGSRGKHNNKSSNRLKNEDEIREILDNFVPDTTTATAAYISSPPTDNEEEKEESGIVYKTNKRHREMTTFRPRATTFSIPRPEINDNQPDKLDWNDLEIIESNLIKPPIIQEGQVNYRKGLRGRFYDDRDDSFDAVPEITYESETDEFFNNNSTDNSNFLLRKGSSNKQKLKFNDWRSVNPTDFDNICGWLPNLWKVQMGNYRVDFYKGNKRKETIIARISPNTCDEFNGKPSANQYFYPKRRNYGFAVCQKKLGKWKKKKNIKNVCTDSKVSWGNSKPPKGVMRRYNTDDFE